VVVAKEDIPEQGRIALSSVTLATMSEEALPARPFTEVPQVVGKFARQRIYRGDILTEDRVIGLQQLRGSEAGGTQSASTSASTSTRAAGSPSMVLDQDQVMVVLPARMQGTFAGQSPNLLTATNAVRDGDYVDVHVTTLELPETMTSDQREYARRENPWDYLRTRVMFQNLRVYHVGTFPEVVQNQNSRGSGAAAAAQSAVPSAATKPDDRYLSFAVNRHTALELKWLKDIVALGHANVDFVLRSPTNQDVTPNEALTVQEIRRDFGVYGNRQ
jgi:hypothetical protein